MVVLQPAEYSLYLSLSAPRPPIVSVRQTANKIRYDWQLVVWLCISLSEGRDGLYFNWWLGTGVRQEVSTAVEVKVTQRNKMKESNY